MTTLADEQCSDLCAVEDGSPTNGKPNPRANKEAAKNRGQEFVWRDVRILDESQTGRQPGNRHSALNSKAESDLPVGKGNERKINQEDQNREWPRKHIRQQHRHSRHATINEMAGKEKPLQS